MDLRADRYSMLLGQDALTFKSILSHASISKARIISIDDFTCDGFPLRQQRLTDELLSHGLLTTSKSHDTRTVPTQIKQSMDDFSHYHSQRSSAVFGPRDVWRFFSACLSIKWQLKHRSIESSVLAVERRKFYAHSHTQSDIHDVLRLVQIYNRLRPFIPQDYWCLFDSLSLLEFLSKYKCFPNLVFAVKLEPWEAHCWVQLGSTALNESANETSAYLPIASI